MFAREDLVKAKCKRDKWCNMSQGNDKNYVTRDLELATIIHALKMWRNYILGKRFILMSDHSGLTYLFYKPNLNVKKARWLDTLSEFDFEVRYIKGKEN